MRICLDSSGYSAFKRGHERALDLIQRAEEVVLPVTVVGELLAGFRMGNRDRSNQGELQRFLQPPRVRIALLDEESAHRYAEIVAFLRGQGTPIPTNDIWIAASAMQWGLRVLTSDTHFSRVPQVSLELLDVSGRF